MFHCLPGRDQAEAHVEVAAVRSVEVADRRPAILRIDVPATAANDPDRA